MAAPAAHPCLGLDQHFTSAPLEQKMLPSHGGRGRGRGSSLPKPPTHVFKPVNLPSRRAENSFGLDPNVQIVPRVRRISRATGTCSPRGLNHARTICALICAGWWWMGHARASGHGPAHGRPPPSRTRGGSSLDFRLQPGISRSNLDSFSRLNLDHGLPRLPQF